MFQRFFKSSVSRSESREDLDAANDERNLFFFKNIPDIPKYVRKPIAVYSTFPRFMQRGRKWMNMRANSY